MSYAAPFNLLSFHVSGYADSLATRLTWPLAGSLAIHVMVLIALVGLRFGPSLEQPSGAYQVALVTLPEISGPRAKPRVPELVTDSLMGALESVVVPKPRAMTVPQQAVPAVPAPLRQLPALEMKAQTIQAPPQPPQLASGPATRKLKSSTPLPSVAPLAPTLKQALGTIVVPKKQKQASSHVSVSPPVKLDREQKQDTIETPRSPGITLPSPLPSRAPLVAHAAPVSREKEAPLQTAQKSPTAESVMRAIQSTVQIPETKQRPAETVSETVPFIPEASPEQSTAAEAQDLHHTVVPPKASPLAKLPIEQELVMIPMTTPKPESDGKIADLPIPQGLASEAHQPVSQQTESGTQETLTNLRAKGSCEEGYWKEVIEKRIEEKWHPPGGELSLQVVLAFRVERKGQVTALTVVRSSGNDYFDLAAKRAVVASSPLPAFPENITKPSCTVQHRFTGQPSR